MGETYLGNLVGLGCKINFYGNLIFILSCLYFTWHFVNDFERANKITSIIDDVITALSPSKNNGKNFKKTLTFHHNTGELKLIHYTEPPFIWNLKCKKIINGNTV